MKLFPDQQKAFWRLFAKACSIHAVPPGEKEAYRKGLILGATGKLSLRAVAPGAEYDALMLETARAACDVEAVNRWYSAPARREAYQINRSLDRLLGADASLKTRCAYLAGMLSRRAGAARIIRPEPNWWEELPREEVTFLLRACAIAARRRGAEEGKRSNRKQEEMI